MTECSLGSGRSWYKQEVVSVIWVKNFMDISYTRGQSSEVSESRLLLLPQERWRSIVMCVSVCACVRVSMCLPKREHISRTTRVIFAIFCACCLSPWLGPPPVGWQNFKGNRSILFFSPIDNALYGSYSGLDFATKDRFCLSLLIYRKVGQNSITDY